MLAAGPFGLGPLEIGIILIVVVLIFGVGKVADLGGALGKSVRDFRRASRDTGDDEEAAAPAQQAVAGAHCSNCGTQLDAGAKFCAKCGTSVSATVN